MIPVWTPYVRLTAPDGSVSEHPGSAAWHVVAPPPEDIVNLVDIANAPVPAGTTCTACGPIRPGQTCEHGWAVKWA